MLRIEQVNKSFGRFQALKDVSLEIQPGEVVALMGPNGSGKSTLMKSLVGLVLPDSGKIIFQGKNIQGQSAYRHHMGYMPQIARYPENLTVAELLSLVQDLRGHYGALDRDLAEAFDLEAMEHKKLRALSGGMKQRVNASLAFWFQPELLILDEPTASLDPLSAEHLKSKIRKQRDQGVAVIISSHIVSEVEELADRIVFMLDGRACMDTAPASLRQATGKERLGAAISEWVKQHDFKQ